LNHNSSPFVAMTCLYQKNDFFFLRSNRTVSLAWCLEDRRAELLLFFSPSVLIKLCRTFLKRENDGILYRIGEGN